jgi:general secretion pathway protein I
LPRTLVGPNDNAAAGFTLIEALVALAVVAVSLVAIGALMGSTARGSRQLERHVALVQAATNVLWLAFPSRSAPDQPTQSGESMAHAWRAEATPFPIDIGVPSGEAAWTPQKIKVRVQSRSGAMIELETVRLFRRPAQ